MEVEVVGFSAHDRCDACSSQALAVARKESFADLMFCMHHKTKHEDALLDAGWRIIEDVETYESYRAPLDVSAV